MKYYILFPDDNEDSTLLDSNLLGEESFGVFWAGSGLQALMNASTKCAEVLPHIIIKTERGEDLTIQEFLTRIEKLKVRTN